MPGQPPSAYNANMVAHHDERDCSGHRAAAVLHRLEAVYGRPSWRPEAHHGPLEELVQTILSQHTSDLNSGRAYESLRLRYPSWADVATAPTTDVAEAIRCGGLARQKARTIQAVLDSVLDEDGSSLLDGLETLPLDVARRRLTGLPGVGPKTAACVLRFACGRPALPGDPHGYRVTRRIGLIPSTVSAEQAHALLEAIVEPEDVYSFHLNLIAHGRRVCTARVPRCDDCVLADICDYGRLRLGVPSGEAPACSTSPRSVA